MAHRQVLGSGLLDSPLLIRLLLCLLPVALLSPQPIAGTEAEEKARLEAVEGHIRSLQQQMNETLGEKRKLLDLLKQTELAEAKLRTHIELSERDIARLDSELALLANQRQTLNRDLEKQSRAIAKEAAAAYRLGREEPLKLLLNQEDPKSITRTLKYYQYFLAARGDKLARFRATLQRLETVETSAREKREELTARRDQLGEQRSRLLTEQRERKKVVAQLDRDLNSDTARLDKLRNERKHLEQILAALQDAIRNLSTPADQPFHSRKGQLLWPAQGRIAYGFGSARASKLRWQGWLVKAPEGSEVKAVHYGRVVFSDYLRGHGLLLILDHGDGYLSLYAHNQVLLKELGEWVTAGEPIARAGRSGGLDSSALYFEIRHNGKPVDPKVWLRPRA